MYNHALPSLPMILNVSQLSSSFSTLLLLFLQLHHNSSSSSFTVLIIDVLIKSCLICSVGNVFVCTETQLYVATVAKH